jgi:hypothetical protein
MDLEEFKSVSAEGKKLIKKLLVVNYDDRPTAEVAL